MELSTVVKYYRLDQEFSRLDIYTSGDLEKLLEDESMFLQATQSWSQRTLKGLIRLLNELEISPRLTLNVDSVWPYGQKWLQKRCRTWRQLVQENQKCGDSNAAR